MNMRVVFNILHFNDDDFHALVTKTLRGAIFYELAANDTEHMFMVFCVMLWHTYSKVPLSHLCDVPLALASSSKKMRFYFFWTIAICYIFASEFDFLCWSISSIGKLALYLRCEIVIARAEEIQSVYVSNYFNFVYRNAFGWMTATILNCIEPRYCLL